MKYYICAVGIIILVFGACQIDDDIIEVPEDLCLNPVPLLPVEPDTCFELPTDAWGMPLASRPPRYKTMPSFNPNNLNEFVCLIMDNQGGAEYPALVKINLCSGIETLLFQFDTDNSPPYGLGRLQWGKTGSIAIISNNSLRLINEEGTDLFTLFESVGNAEVVHPAWFNEGQIIHIRRDMHGSARRNLLLDAQTGQVVDSLPITVTRPQYRNNRIAAIYNGAIGFLNAGSEQFHALVELLSGPQHHVKDMTWLNNEKIVWTSSEGIFSIDIENQEIDTIRFTPCENKYYTFLTVPENEKNQVFVQRGEFKYVSPDSLVHFGDIAIIDLDTNEEWILQLD